jgi:serine/threonine protein kinase
VLQCHDFLIVLFQNNILIGEKGIVRITDFGLTRYTDWTTGGLTGLSNTHSKSERFTAPELHSPAAMGLTVFKRTYASDVYAFACTCVEVNLLSFCKIFQGVSNMIKTALFHEETVLQLADNP